MDKRSRKHTKYNKTVGVLYIGIGLILILSGLVRINLVEIWILGAFILLIGVINIVSQHEIAVLSERLKDLKAENLALRFGGDSGEDTKKA